jgi:hypothetical protein
VLAAVGSPGALRFETGLASIPSHCLALFEGAGTRRDAVADDDIVAFLGSVIVGRLRLFDTGAGRVLPIEHGSRPLWFGESGLRLRERSGALPCGLQRRRRLVARLNPQRKDDDAAQGCSEKNGRSRHRYSDAGRRFVFTVATRDRRSQAANAGGSRLAEV